MAKKLGRGPRLRLAARNGIQWILVFGMAVPSHAAPAGAISIDDVLRLVADKSETVRSFEQSLSSLESEIRSRDLVLSPTVSSELAFIKDQRRTLSSSGVSSRQDSSGLVDVTISKPFATGTTLSATVGHEIVEPANGVSEQNVSDWEVRLSQSLWRDAFGRSTQLRHKAEASELRGRRFGLLFQKQQLLVDVETSYWDLVLALKEEELRLENIARSRTLVRWAQDRLRRAAVDQTDLFQVQALLSQRQLELISVRNRIEVLRNRFRQLLPGVDPSQWKLDLKGLDQARQPNSLLATSQAAPNVVPVRMDALSSLYLAEQADFEAKRVSDSLRPSLDAYVAYGSTGVESGAGGAIRRSLEGDSTGTRIGLLLTAELDTGLKSERRTAATLKAQSQESQAQALIRASEVGWGELKRNIENLGQQIKEARELAKLQSRKAQSERKRYEQGRTTALQLTTFEVDAAESEIRLYRLQAELRKAESVARTYAVEESESR